MKWYGKIGYGLSTDDGHGVWTHTMTWKTYYGDVQRNVRRWDGSQYINDNININNTISIVADPYAFNNVGFMKCIEWMGTLWDISNAEVNYPRIILNIGGVYNGDSTGFTESV